jgi:hypothetical protein
MTASSRRCDGVFTMRKMWAGSLAVAMMLSFTSIAGAEQPLAISLLQQIPPDVLDIAYAHSSPMTNGLNGSNAVAWADVGEQRGAMEPIALGAIRGDASLVDSYWPAIDAAFAHQLPDGSFDHPTIQANGKPFDVRGEPTGEAFFVADSVEALLLLRESKLAPRYASRIDALLPRYRAELSWLVQPAHVSQMLLVDAGATNRLFYDAKAFLLGSILTNYAPARSVGEMLLTRALSVQSPAGWFPEHGGPDTSYNAVSGMVLAQTALWADDPRIPVALLHCVNWELSQVHDDGRVETASNTRTGIGGVTEAGRPYNVNYPQVVRMLAVAGVVLKHDEAIAGARRVATYHRARPKE